MKKLIRFVLFLGLIAGLGILAFSSNPNVVKARTFVSEKGKELFDKGTDELKQSENETLAKIGETIQ